MKKTILAVTIFCVAAGGARAQKESNPLPYNKEKLDSLFRQLSKTNQPFVLPVPKGYTMPDNTGPLGAWKYRNERSVETIYPGAVVISRGKRGIVYNMPLDNMAVLVPYNNNTERMPGDKSVLKMAPRNRMPNPLYKEEDTGKK